MNLAVAPNFRDVGPLPVVGGGALRSGAIFRSDAVLAPGPADVAAFRTCGIRLAFDLRSNAEAQRAPNSFLMSEGIEHHNLDLLAAFPRDHDPWAALRDNPTRAGAEALMQALYGGMPRAALAHLPQLLARAADGGVPLLVHCTAGKDRTGFMIAMLLAAVGVEPQAIEADYMASAGRKTDAAREATRQMAINYVGSDISVEALEGLMGVNPSYLAASFTSINNKFGGTEAYLASAGLDPAKRAALRALLIE